MQFARTLCNRALPCAHATYQRWVAPREQGGVFGVRAEVVLDLSTRRASVELEGAPIGGRIAGTATLDPRGTVALDPDLSRALRRRFVSIVDVAADRSMRECRVLADLPIFGDTNITLTLVDW